MHIWVDGDACPKAIKDIVFRAASKRKIKVFIVANHFIPIPLSSWIERIIVENGCDKADEYIINQLHPFDLVVTADILFAQQALEKKALALNPRGTLYTANNIRQMVSIRAINESLRSGNYHTSGPEPFNAKHSLSFANELDKIITKYQL